MAAAIAISLVQFGATVPAEDFAYNRLTELRGERAWDDRVVVVEIDDRSMAEFSDLQTNRSPYVKLVEILNKYNASTIAFEPIFKHDSASDRAFRTAINNHKNTAVILSQSWNDLNEELKPNSTLSKAAYAIGHIDKVKSHDGVVRRIQQYKGKVNSFAWMAVEGYNSNNDSKIKRPQNDDDFWINWPGKVAKVKHYSFDTILAAKEYSDLGKVFNNKIVLVGMTGNNAKRIDTPFDRVEGAANIYLHAAVVDNLLQQDQLQIIADKWLFFAIFGISPFLSYQLSGLTHGRRLLAALGLTGGWISIVTLSLASNYWLPAAAPITLVLLTTLGDRKSTRLNSSHRNTSRMPSSA